MTPEDVPGETGPATEATTATDESAAEARIDLGLAPAPIETTDTFAAAGRKAMWLHVDRMLAREEELRDPGQKDSLRKYRVATRRLRAALRLFREAYPAREVKALRDGLGAVAREVGTVRDLDVRIADLDAWTVETGADAVGLLAPLREAWVDQRGQAVAALDHRLGTKRHRRLAESLAAFVTNEAVSDATGIDPARTVRDRAASSTWLAYERLRAFTAVYDGAGLETLHAIRIEAKRLRYTLEFLAPALGPQREWLVARLVALQDHLGHLNDAAVNVAAIRTFLEERQAEPEPGERRSIEAYLASRERLVATLQRGVPRVWRPVIDATFAGRLGRAVIGPSSPEQP